MNSWTAITLRMLLSVVILMTTVPGSAAQHEPCPAEHGGTHSVASDADAAAQMSAMPGHADTHECCDQEKTARLGVEICEPGAMQCQAPAFVLQLTPKTILDSGRSPLLFTYLFSLSSAPVNSFWRPPRA